MYFFMSVFIELCSQFVRSFLRLLVLELCMYFFIYLVRPLFRDVSISLHRSLVRCLCFY